MIDHVSIGVSDLIAATALYEAMLAPLGLTKLAERDDAVGFGKRYPEFWLNRRPGLKGGDNGVHVCLRARREEAVDAFHAAGLALRAKDDGAPGRRPHYTSNYYAAFLIDTDGNRIEAVCFLTGD